MRLKHSKYCSFVTFLIFDLSFGKPAFLHPFWVVLFSVQILGSGCKTSLWSGPKICSHVRLGTPRCTTVFPDLSKPYSDPIFRNSRRRIQTLSKAYFQFSLDSAGCSRARPPQNMCILVVSFFCILSFFVRGEPPPRKACVYRYIYIYRW